VASDPVSRSGSRRESRETALGLLYAAEIRGCPAREELDRQPLTPDRYVQDMVRGIAEHQDDLDALIARFAKGWRIDRMPAIDRLLLRMGCWELVHRADIPTGAVLNEAVELARQFSTEDSSRFVNGVLAAVAKDARGA
jgi:transcription antitermination protein NusB